MYTFGGPPPLRSVQNSQSKVPPLLDFRTILEGGWVCGATTRTEPVSWTMWEEDLRLLAIFRTFFVYKPTMRTIVLYVQNNGKLLLHRFLT